MSSKVINRKVLVLGGSKGLGLALCGRYSDAVPCSRNADISADFNKMDSINKVVSLLEEYKPGVVFYVAGGGPHGDFFSKSFKSHQWAYQVNYFTPIALAYTLIEKKYKGTFVYIGSAIAERSNSHESLSYSQSKKNAKQSLLSLNEKDLKVRVFSPPYMNTEMLTKNAWPRIEAPHLVLEPEDVAEELTQWLENNKAAPVVSKRGFDVRHFDWLEHFAYDIPTDKII